MEKMKTLGYNSRKRERVLGLTSKHSAIAGDILKVKLGYDS